jgi:ribosomal protein S18 acetylase RimI-like enzyme
VLVTVDDVYGTSTFEPALVGAGYELRVREPEHRMFRTPEHEAVGLVTYQRVHLLYRPRPHCRVTALVVRQDRRRRGIARALLGPLSH